MTPIPLLGRRLPDDPIAWYRNERITCSEFLADVAQLSRRLPDRQYVLNLCEDRYHFLVGFAAALIRRQISLFPPARTPKMLEQMREEHDDVYSILDDGQAPDNIESFRYVRNTVPANISDVPSLPGDTIAALVFTSGTTGRPLPHLKTWGSLVSVAKRTAVRFALDEERLASIIATVPPQHMYGLETGSMLPLQSRCAIHSGRPFFPHDVSHALEVMSTPRILVTTPVHLRACVAAGISYPSLDFVLSATAPLPMSLAADAEAVFASKVLEVYGSTETGVIATRRTIEGEIWQALDGISLHGNGDQCTVDGDHFAEPVPLNDIVHVLNERQLTLLGRKSDLINIAGKRMSLNDLNHKLSKIGGVKDGVFIMPEEGDAPITRLIAFVVAPGCSHDDIMAGLRSCIDPVFLPRPLYLVDSLPRNQTGKLARADLLQLAICLDTALDGTSVG